MPGRDHLLRGSLQVGKEPLPVLVIILFPLVRLESPVVDPVGRLRHTLRGNFPVASQDRDRVPGQ